VLSEETPLRVSTVLLALSAFTSLATEGRGASADPDPRALRLVWVRGERTQDCGDRAAIARRVVERLGRDVFSEAASRSIEGVIQHEGERWDAHLYVRDANGGLSGSRYLTSTGPDCTALDAAVTLAIALAIDPDAAFRPTSTGSSTMAPSASAPSLAAALPPAPTQPVLPIPTSQTTRPAEVPTAIPSVDASRFPKSLAPPRRGSLSVAARALVAVGVLPVAGAGAALSAQGPVDRTFQGTAGVLYLPEVRTPSGGFAFGLTAGWLGVCAQPWTQGRIALAICGTILFGALHSVVFALDPIQPGDTLWSSASLSIGARVRIAGPLIAEVGAEALFPFTREQFLVKGAGTPAFQEGSVGGFGFGGLGVSIP
jgi:hypothetical protein